MVDPANVEQANKHKDEGNGFLKAKKFHEAVEAYSKVSRSVPDQWMSAFAQFWIVYMHV